MTAIHGPTVGALVVLVQDLRIAAQHRMEHYEQNDCITLRARRARSRYETLLDLERTLRVIAHDPASYEAELASAMAERDQAAGTVPHNAASEPPTEPGLPTPQAADTQPHTGAVIDLQRTTALARARAGVMLDGTACTLAWAHLVDDFGHDLAGEVWTQACREADAQSDSQEGS
jgi:hypothetical protein